MFSLNRPMPGRTKIQVYGCTVNTSQKMHVPKFPQQYQLNHIHIFWLVVVYVLCMPKVVIHQRQKSPMLMQY